MDNAHQIVDDLKAADITTETISAFKDFLDKSSPEIITKIVLQKLVPHLFKGGTKNRNELLDLIIKCTKIEIKYLNKAEKATFKLQCLQEFVDDIDKLQAADSTDWSILCITLFRILGTALHNDVEIINRVLKSIENGFRNKPAQKCEAYKCWMGLIRNYNIVPSYLKQPKQMRLLIKPLKVPLSKQACVVELRFDTFILLLEAVGIEIMSNYLDFLPFVFNIGNASACEATVILPNYKNIWPKSAAVLFQSLGCDGNIELLCNYKTNMDTVVDIKYFKQNYKCIVYAARICSELTYQWCSKPNVIHIIEPVWTSIFKLSHNCGLEKDVLSNILDHFKELFRIASSNDFMCDFIIMPVLEITYKNPEFNSATFRSDLLIPFIKLYITHTNLHNRSRNDSVAKVVSSNYSSNSLIDLYPLLDSSTYCEVLELIWFQCNSMFISELEQPIKHNVPKSNVLMYLKWPVGNVKYLNTNECTLKLWKSTLLFIHKSDPDIISQLLDALKLLQQENSWIIVNIMLVGAVLLEIAARKTTTMECIAITVNECLENSAKEIEQFMLYKNAFFQSYMVLLKHVTTNMSVFSSMLQDLDRFFQRLPDLIIKSIPHSFIKFMETSSRMSNSIEAVNIITKIKPNALHSTPTVISRSKKMASLNYSPLLPNFPKNMNTTDSPSDKKKTVTLSASTDISGFEHNLGSSPSSIKSSFFDRAKNKSIKSVKQDTVTINSRTKSIMDFADSAFVQIDKVVSPDLTRMSIHQRDALRRRRDDIPALYSDLSQSLSQHAALISPEASNTQNSEKLDHQPQKESMSNNTDDCDLEPTQLLSDNIIDQPQPTMESVDDCNAGVSAMVVNKPTAVLQEGIDCQIEKTHRKKLFNDVSDTDTNSMDSDVNVFIHQKPRQDLFNIGKDPDSKYSCLNELDLTIQLSKNTTDLKVCPDKSEDIVNDDTRLSENATADLKVCPDKNEDVVNDDKKLSKNTTDLKVCTDENEDFFNDDTKLSENTTDLNVCTDKNEAIVNDDLKLSKNATESTICADKIETVGNDNSDHMTTKSPKDRKKKSKDKNKVLRTEIGDETVIKTKTKSDTKMPNRLSRLSEKYDKSRNLKSKSKNSSNLKIRAIKGFKSCSKSKFSILNEKETGDKFIVEKIRVSPEAIVSEISNKISKKVDLSNQSKPIESPDLSANLLDLENIEGINDNNSKRQSITEKKSKVKFVTKWKTYNEPAKHITGDSDVYPIVECNNLLTNKGDNEIHSQSEIEKEMENSNKVDNSSTTIPATSEVNCDDIPATQNSPDIIAETEPIIEEKIILKDKLKNELNRLRMDIVGGDMAACVTSKRIRKEKFDLRKPNKTSKPRIRLSLKNDKRIKAGNCNNDKFVHNDSTSSFTSESTSENESMKNDLEQNVTVSTHTIVDIADPQQIDESSEKDKDTVSQPLVDSESEIIKDIPNTEPEVIFANNGQQMFAESELENQLVDTEKHITTEVLEDFNAEDNLEAIVASSVDNSNENSLPEMTINTTNEAIDTKENIDDINSEEPDEIMETPPLIEPFMNVSFIGSMDIQPDIQKDDIHTKDTLSIGINEIDTETCNSSCTSVMVEPLKPDADKETDLIPSSPITKTTPSKNQILLTDTLDVSPIGSTKTVEDVPKCNSPDLFESETVTAIEKVFESNECQSAHIEQNYDVSVIKTVDSDSKNDAPKQNVDIPKGNNPFMSHLAPLKLLTPSSIVSSPKTHRIQKMMQNLGDKNSSMTTDSKAVAPNYNKEDLLEFSADLPKPDARPRTPSILKRKAPDYLDDGVSPLSKRKRVNFSDPPTTCSKVYLKCEEETFMQRVFRKTGKFAVKPQCQNSQNDMNFNIKVNIKNSASTSDTEGYAENECPSTTKVITSELESTAGELSDLYPELIDCTEDIEILHNMTNSIDEIKNKGIKTIADLVRLKLSDIEVLPFAEPKFTQINSALSLYCCKNKNISYNIQAGENIHKIITVDCSDKSISNVNIINNIILSPKHINKDNPFGLAAITQNIKNNVLQLVTEGYSPDEIGDQLNNILRCCNLPLSINLPYY